MLQNSPLGVLLRVPVQVEEGVSRIEQLARDREGPSIEGRLPSPPVSPNARTFRKPAQTLCRLAFAGVLVAAGCGGVPDGGPLRPNIVLVLADDLGWKDLGCQGSPVYETPNIDRLAAGGTRFLQAYSNCPVCSPSRAALLTGQSPGRVGFTGHITAIGRHRYPETGAIVPPQDFMYLRHEVVTVAEALRTAGYASASIGKWHLGHEPYWPLSQGFDANVAGHTHGSPASYFFPYRNASQEWNPDMPNLDLSVSRDGEYLTDRLTREALRFIERNRDGAFFLYLSHYTVHTPLQAPDELVGRHEARIAALGAGSDPTYSAMVETLDASVGRVLDRLEELGIADRTVVIFASDNGGLASVTDNAPLRAGKGHLYEGGIRVPLIVRWPGRGARGSLVDVPVTNADLYPTIVEAAGLSPEQFPAPDGRSLAALIDREEWSDRDLVWYYPHYSPQAQAPGAAIRSGRFKLIEFYDPAAVELYDLEADVGEERDLAASMPDRTADLRARLNSWIEANVPIRHSPNPSHDPAPR